MEVSTQKNAIQVFGLFVLALLVFSCQKEKVILTKDESKYQQNVSVDLASQIALNFTKNEALADSYIVKGSVLKSGSLPSLKRKEIEKVSTIMDESNTPAIYIINYKPNGFVILSATKKESPVLAFSENNVIDNNFDAIGLSDWISVRKKRIENLKRDNNYKVPKSVQDEWLAAAPPEDEEIIVSGGTVYEQVGPFLPTIWGQAERYNDELTSLQCENTLNGRPQTGCVATAMAQIMRYWQHPSTYSWSIMPSYTNRYMSATTGTLEIAKLMKDIGSAVNMVYDCTQGSTSSLPYARTAFVNTFSYSSTASIINYNSSTIESYFIPQIQMNMPILMSGVDAIRGVGHAWVCDGYKRNVQTLIHNPGTVYEYETFAISGFYLSLNWGWNGSSNGWFLYTNFNPSDYNFGSGQQCIIGIQP